MNPVIKDKIAAITQLFKELDELAAQEATPTQYPIIRKTGYLPEAWVARYQELRAIPKNDRTKEQSDELDTMYDEMPYPCSLSEYPEDMKAGNAWMPSTCW